MTYLPITPPLRAAVARFEAARAARADLVCPPAGCSEDEALAFLRAADEADAATGHAADTLALMVALAVRMAVDGEGVQP